MQYVGVSAAKTELDGQLKTIWQSGVFDVRRFPAEPEDIPDDPARPRLVVVHYDAASARDEDEAPPGLVRQLYERAGAAGGFRTFQNNVLFLVADTAQTQRMIEAARYWKAVSRLAEDPERARHLTAEQQKRLRDRKDAGLVELRLAIHRAYRFLYYPSADAPRATGGLAREALPAQDQGDIKRDQSQVVLEALRRLEKVYTADDPPIAPQFIRSKAWPAGRSAVRVAELARTFAMRRGLRMLLDARPLREGLLEGIRRGLWVYYDPQEGAGYGAPSPTAYIDLAGEGELLEPAEARARGVAIKGEGAGAEAERCPVCEQPASACTCGPVPEPPSTPHLQAEGAVDQALQALVDQMHDRKIDTLERLTVRVQGEGASGLQELRSLGLAVPQLGPGSYRLDVRVTAELGPGDALRLEFRGPWDRYRRLKDGLEGLLAQAARLEAQAGIECGFDNEGGTVARLMTIREVLRSLNLGRVVVSAEPRRE